MSPDAGAWFARHYDREPDGVWFAVTDRFTHNKWPEPHYLDAVPSDGARRLR